MALVFEINSDVASLDEPSTRNLIPFCSRKLVVVNELNDNSLIWKTDSIKLVDIWNSTYGITTNHSDIKNAIGNDLERSLSVHS